MSLSAYHTMLRERAITLPKPDDRECGNCVFFGGVQNNGMDGSCLHVRHRFPVNKSDWCDNPNLFKQK